MNTFTTQRPQMTLACVSTRTTNAEEAGPNRRLPKLWETYFSGNTAAQPYNQHPHRIYALYTDYESDATGAYTTLIGHEVKQEVALSEIEGAYAIVPESQYIVFTTERGPVYEVVAQAWMKIWEYFKDSAEVRTFTGDFELYDGIHFDPTNAEVQIYIAIQ